MLGELRSEDQGVISRGQGACHHQAWPVGAARCCSGPYRQAAVAPGTPGKSPPESHLLWWSRWSARVLWNASTNLTSCHPWQQSPEDNSFLSSNFHISQECLSLAKSHLEPRWGIPGDVISDVSETQKEVVVMLSWEQTVHKYRNLL